MPAALVPVIASWLAVSTFVASAIVYGTLLIGSLAYSASQRRQGERDAKSAYNASQVDRLANVSLTVAPRELVLGRVRKGGNVFFKGSTGANKEKFVMLVALAGHEIDVVEQIFLNDVPVTLDGSGYVQDAPYTLTTTLNGSLSVSVTGYSDGGSGGTWGFVFVPGSGLVWTYTAPTATTRPGYPAAPANANPGSITQTFVPDAGDRADPNNGRLVTTYQYNVITSKIRIRSVLGAAGQAADATVMALFPGLWTAAHRAAGTAYLIVDCDYDETAFPSGLPSVSGVIRGAKVGDPRTGSTAWSQNPALMARHILLHPQFGKRTALTAAEDSRIIAAANACDAGYNYGDGAVPLYRAAIVLPWGTTARDALDDLTQAMGGAWAYAAGEFYIRAGVYTAPVLALSDADLAVVTTGSGTSQQPISISPHRSRNEKINVVTPRIWDAAQGYKHVALPPLKGTALIARDGAELVQEVDMQAVFYARQALHIAGVLMRDARDPLTVTLPFKMSAYRVELFDTISLSLARFGWVAKQFSVMSRTWSHDGKILLTLKETTAAIFQPDAAFVVGGYASNTALPKPWEIYPPTITSITSGTSELVKQADGTIIVRVRVQWRAIIDLSVLQGGNIELQWQQPGAAGWFSVVVPGGETQAFLTSVPDGVPILIRARTRNPLAVSDWGLQQAHFVIGKTEPPANVSSFTIAGDTLSWTPVTDLDLAGYALRFQYGGSTDWGSATPLHTGLITENPWSLVARPSGLATIMIKAVDTSGNPSNQAAAIVQDLGDAPVANVVETIDLDALGYPGTLVGGSRSGGDLLATNINGFYGPGMQSFYGQGSDSFYKNTSYDAMVYVSSAMAVGKALAGSLGTLVIAYAGVDLRIDYRMAGQQPFYGPGTGSFYGAGPDPFYGAPGAWLPWPGQMAMENDVYQFRVSIGSGALRGQLKNFAVVIDAPDIVEYVNDLSVSAIGTAIPYSKPFTKITNIQVTLQANLSGAETVEINKALPMTPKARAFNSAHTAVAGSTIDLILKGY